MYVRNAFLALSTGLWIGVTLLAGLWMVGALMVGPVMYLLHTYVPGQTAPAPNSHFVAKQTHAIAYVSLSGTVPTRQSVGQEAELHVHVDSSDASLVPVLYLQGLNAWRIVVPGSQRADSNPTVGGCTGGGDGVPFVLHEQVSHRVYVQIPYEHCDVDLYVVPRGIGRYPLTIKVYTPTIANVNPEMAWNPHNIDRSWLLKAVQLRWDVAVQR